MRGIRCKGRSALRDGIYFGVEQFNRTRDGRKVVLVISDGTDDSSRRSEKDIRLLAKQLGVTVNTIGVYSGKFHSRFSNEELAGRAALSVIARESNGEYLAVEYPDQFKKATDKFAATLRASP